MKQIVTHNETETIDAGKVFARQLIPGSVVALFGDLGSGKTRFAKGISRGLGLNDNVTSPTFTIVNEHIGGRIPLYHFDFYRLKTLSELEEIGFDEYIYGNGACVLEWADMVQEKLPSKRFDIHFSLGENEHDRIITITEL